MIIAVDDKVLTTNNCYLGSIAALHEILIRTSFRIHLIQIPPFPGSFLVFLTIQNVSQSIAFVVAVG